MYTSGLLAEPRLMTNPQLPRMRTKTLDVLWRDPGMWASVDLGLSREGRTGDLLIHGGVPQELTFVRLSEPCSCLAMTVHGDIMVTR